jgi:hypothetical protein
MLSVGQDVVNLVQQRIPEQGLFDDRNVRLLGALAQQNAGMACYEDRRRRNVALVRARRRDCTGSIGASLTGASLSGAKKPA